MTKYDYQEGADPVISREEMYGMWEPYGQRIPDMPALGPDDIDLVMAEHIIYHTTREELEAIRAGLGLGQFPSEKVFSRTLDYCEVNGITPAAAEGFLAALDRQISHEQSYREAEMELWPGILQLLATRVPELAARGLCPPGMVEELQERLVPANGVPLFEHASLMPAHLAWTERSRGQTISSPQMGAYTDYASGITVALLPPDFRNTDRVQAFNANRVHEQVHAVLHGLEIHLQQRNGVFEPEALVTGLFGGPVPEDGSHDFTYADCFNFASNEALVHQATGVLLPSNGCLGELKNDGDYAAWASNVTELQYVQPRVMEAMVEAVFVDATPANPQAKRASLERMDGIANDAFGMPHALNVFMTGSEEGIVQHAQRQARF